MKKNSNLKKSKRKGQDNPDRNLTRIDQMNGSRPVKGWEVRIHRRGQHFNRFFSDSVHGGNKKALEKARELRDQQEKKLKPWTRRELAERTTVRNTSGHRGVRLRKTVLNKNGKKYTYEHVEASWSPEPGKVVKKTFSVAKLGLRQAWNDAVAARNKGIESIRD